MSKVKKEMLGAAAFFLALLVFIFSASAVMFPKGVTMESTWNLWGPYKEEPENSLDAFIMGNSLTYCDLIPPQIYEETGYSTYLISGPQQTLAMGWFALQEAYKTQRPSAIFLEMTCFFYPRYTRYTKEIIGSMPWTENRLSATFQAAEPNAWPALLFPLFGYHDRWSELGEEDYKNGLFGYDRDMMAGYTLLTTVSPQSEITPRKNETTPESYEWNLRYFEKLATFCQEKNIKLVCFLSPGFVRFEEKELASMERVLSEYNLSLVDYNRVFEEIGMEGNGDYYDTSHLTFQGAQRFTGEFCKLVTMTLRDTAPKDNAPVTWQKRVDYFHEQQENPEQAKEEGLSLEES